MKINHILLATTLAALLPVSASAADAVVKFNIQVNADKIDPQVNAVGLGCRISDAPGGGAGSVIASGTWPPPNFKPVNPNGTFTGILVDEVTVPAAKVKDAKGWQCGVVFRGPNNELGVSNQPWAELAPGMKRHLGGNLP